MEKLTPLEQEIYDYIANSIESEGYSPSVRDIRTALNIRSTSTVHLNLQHLEDKGFIRKEQGKSRTLRIGGGSDGNIPIIGRIAAGSPVFAEENFDGYLEFRLPQTYKNDSVFALRVEGQSMIEAGIFNGDLIVVTMTSYAENGDIVVALINDEATVKTFYKENGHFRLQPENSTMKPIIVKDVRILGKVIASVRYY